MWIFISLFFYSTFPFVNTFGEQLRNGNTKKRERTEKMNTIGDIVQHPGGVRTIAPHADWKDQDLGEHATVSASTEKGFHPAGWSEGAHTLFLWPLFKRRRSWITILTWLFPHTFARALCGLPTLKQCFSPASSPAWGNQWASGSWSK